MRKSFFAFCGYFLWQRKKVFDRGGLAKVRGEG
jgi:hypothetical protein